MLQDVPAGPAASAPPTRPKTRSATRPHAGPRDFRFRVAFSLLACLGILLAGCGGKKEKAHRELPYAELDNALQPLRRDFEDAAGKVRLVGVVAPTCGECVSMVETLNARLLPTISTDDFEIFLAWISVIPPDVSARAEDLADRYADPRIRNYWDGAARIGRAFGQHAGLPPGSAAYGIFYLYGRNDTWDATGHMGSEAADYNALMDGWMPSNPRERCGQHPNLRLPELRVDSLQAQIKRLLAEPDAGAGSR